MMALAQRAFGTRPQTDPWGNPAGTDSYEEWYAEELARQKQEALMSQVQRQQPYYGPEGYAPGGVGPGGLGSNNFPSGGTAIPPAFGSYFRGWGENAPQQVEPEPNFTPRPDDREPASMSDRQQKAPLPPHDLFATFMPIVGRMQESGVPGAGEDSAQEWWRSIRGQERDDLIQKDDLRSMAKSYQDYLQRKAKEPPPEMQPEEPWDARRRYAEKHIDVTRPVVIAASSVRTATQARDVLRQADKNTLVIEGMSEYGAMSDKFIIVPGKGDSAIDPEKVLDATSPPVLTQGMAAKLLKHLAKVVP